MKFLPTKQNLENMSLQPSSKTEIDDKLYRVETSTNGANGALAIDPEAEKKLLRKCDLRLLLPLKVVYFLSFMDRTNIGSSLYAAHRSSCHCD